MQVKICIKDYSRQKIPQKQKSCGGIASALVQLRLSDRGRKGRGLTTEGLGGPCFSLVATGS